LIKNAKDTEREGQNGHFREFSGPWLAWAPNFLRGEGTSLLQDEASARLGELQVHQVPFFAINKREGG